MSLSHVKPPPAPSRKKINFFQKTYSESHKFLFADAESIHQLLQFINDDWIRYVCPENITLMSNEFIERVLGREQSKNFRRKISDIVAKVSFCCGKEKEEKMVYIILEHQSSVDYAMSDRQIFEYPVIDVRALEEDKILNSSGRVAA